MHSTETVDGHLFIQFIAPLLVSILLPSQPGYNWTGIYASYPFCLGLNISNKLSRINASTAAVRAPWTR